jgi:hypothetical protein
MKEAYLHVRRNQHYAAEKNRARRTESSKPITFNPGDLVLKWEPSLQVETASEKQPGRVPIPGKWKDNWSGPHLVAKVGKPSGSHPDGNKYWIQLAETGKQESIHVNMLHLFTPWSDEVLSSSGCGDDPRGWSDRGRVPIGNLFAIPLRGGYNFGIGRVTGTIAARDGKGDYLQYQWLGNKRSNLKGQPIFPGWLRPRDPATGDRPEYYAEKAESKDDAPYSGATSKTPIRDTDVLLHSFCLTEGQRLPIAIHRSIVAATTRIDQ